MLPYTAEETRLAGLLRLVAAAAALLCLISFWADYVGASAGAFVQPPWVSNTVAGLGVVALLAWLGAGDVRRFRSMIRLVVAAFALGALLLALLSQSTYGRGQAAGLLAASAVMALLAALLLWTTWRTPELAPVLPWTTDKPLTLAEQFGRLFVGAFGLSSLIFSTALFVPALPDAFGGFFREPLFVAGSSVKIALLGLCALTAALSIRRQADLVTVLILGHVGSFLAAAVSLLGIARFGATTVVAFGVTIGTDQIMRGVLLSDLALIVVFTVAKLAMDRSRLDQLGYLGTLEFRAIEALADALLSADAVASVPSHLIALRLDGYLASFPSRRLGLTRLAIIGLELMPLLRAQPPLSLLAPPLRRAFLDWRFKQDIAERRLRGGLAGLYYRLIDMLQAAIRIGSQGVYIGYYGDPAVQERIGYVPFSKRFPGYERIERHRPYPRLSVTTPSDLRRQGIDVIEAPDVVVIGSGAAGAVLAEQLLAQGRDVLMLEKGLYVHPDDFTEDEVEMIGNLYGDGALQASQSFRFQIIQGNCVGGSTTVNNAVCFDTPSAVLEHWNDPSGADAGIELEAFRRSQQLVNQRLDVRSIADSHEPTLPLERIVNPTAGLIESGFRRLYGRPGDELAVVRANIAGCLGCGYCNIGCAFGRKLSMLDEVLPRAQRDHGADRFRIISEAEVLRLNGDERRVRELVVQLRDGRQLFIRNPNTVVVSAGTVASSWLLMQSGIGRGELPVGEHLGFNMGSPLYGLWPGRNVNAYAGLQISHYLRFADKPGFVCESWYNPPVSQALAMPGWLEVHEENMRRYRDWAAVGILVGTEPTASVTPALIARGAPDVVYQATPRDLETLVDALTILGRIMLASGAEKVMASAASFKYGQIEDAVFEKEQDLPRLAKLVKTDRDIIIGTGHPQGGNAISRVRGQGRGVVRPDFRVYGFDNLYVCDASVFPGPTTVNPQITVMTMAHYAASRIAAES
jgi:choline dehydrogenase-like flavoprotein